MADSQILDMPMELGLELVAVVSPYFLDAEGELFDDVIDEGDGICLVVLFKDFQGTDARGVVDSSVLESTDLLTLFSDKCQELDIHLDVMAGDLFVVSLSMHFAHARSARKPI